MALFLEPSRGLVAIDASEPTRISDFHSGTPRTNSARTLGTGELPGEPFLDFYKTLSRITPTEPKTMSQMTTAIVNMKNGRRKPVQPIGD